MTSDNPFEDVANAFDKFTKDFVEAFGFTPRFRYTIPAQDVVIEDVTEDETKEDEDDGRDVRNRTLPDVR